MPEAPILHKCKKHLARGGWFVGAGVLVGVFVLVATLVRGHWSPRTGTESRAVASLRAYAQAQFSFWESKRRSGDKPSYARDLRQLKGALPSEVVAAHGLLGEPYNGYLFLEMKTIAGEAINWGGDFALCAIPAEYGRTGYRTFIVCTNGVVLGKDRASPSFMSDYPNVNELTAGGWICEPYTGPAGSARGTEPAQHTVTQ